MYIYIEIVRTGNICDFALGCLLASDFSSASDSGGL